MTQVSIKNLNGEKFDFLTNYVRGLHKEFKNESGVAYFANVENDLVRFYILNDITVLKHDDIDGTETIYAWQKER